MFRSTILGSILAAIVTPAGIFLNNTAMTPAPLASDSLGDARLSQSLTKLSETLVSFETRQTGSESELTRQIEQLTKAVAITQQANQSQIDALSRSLADIKKVAANDEANFEQMLNKFAERIETQFVKAEAEEKPPVPESKGVGTLDVNRLPSDSSDVESIQTMSDAARRIIALEKEVVALKARCKCETVSSATGSVSSPVYYESPSYQVVSGGCTGTTYSYSQPVQSSYYSQPVQQAYYQPSVSRSYSRSYQSARGTCRIVNGRRVCN